MSDEAPAQAPGLQQSLAEFYGIPPGSVSIQALHLPRATERAPLLQRLEMLLRSPIEIREAADGAALVADGHPTLCAKEKDYTRTAGEVGCLVSHVRAAEAALAAGHQVLVLFEDDCIPTDTFSLPLLRVWLQSIRHFQDKFGLSGPESFLLLSTGGCYKKLPLGVGFSVTNYFNCTHAVVLGQSMMRMLVGTYRHLLKRGRMLPIDCLYSLLLRIEKQWAVCPATDDLFFTQDTTKPSYVQKPAPPSEPIEAPHCS